MTESQEQQHLEALKLSVSIAKFAIQERYMDLINDNTPLHFRRVVGYESPTTPFTIEDWETSNKNHWDFLFTIKLKQ